MYIYIYWRGGTVLGGPLSNPTQQRKQPSRSSMALMSPPCPRTLRCPRLPIREIAQNPRFFFVCGDYTCTNICSYTSAVCVFCLWVCNCEVLSRGMCASLCRGYTWRVHMSVCRPQKQYLRENLFSFWKHRLLFFWFVGMCASFCGIYMKFDCFQIECVRLWISFWQRMCVSMDFVPMPTNPEVHVVSRKISWLDVFVFFFNFCCRGYTWRVHMSVCLPQKQYLRENLIFFLKKIV